MYTKNPRKWNYFWNKLWAEDLQLLIVNIFGRIFSNHFGTLWIKGLIKYFWSYSGPQSCYTLYRYFLHKDHVHYFQLKDHVHFCKEAFLCIHVSPWFFCWKFLFNFVSTKMKYEKRRKCPNRLKGLEAANGGVLYKKVFLEISQNS